MMAARVAEPLKLHARRTFSLASRSSNWPSFPALLAISSSPTSRIAARLSARNATSLAPSAGPDSPANRPFTSDDEHSDAPKHEPSSPWKSTAFKLFETVATTFASIVVLGLAGYGYHVYYKDLVLRKIEIAFKPGDPVLELAARSSLSERAAELHDQGWIRRAEQDLIDAIVGGAERGHYWLLIGEKGVGKSSMLIDAMQRVDGEGIAMLEAHADLEIFRVRLGRALNYEFHEDYIGSLFSIKGPRDTTPLLDIERAFNKLEKIALRRRKRIGRPMVLIINGTHLLRNDHDGRDLLELIQQRAEQWAGANLVTVVFNSDDYWVYERLKQLATRLEVLPVLDLPRRQALNALASYRGNHFPNDDPPPALLEQIYAQVGGRLTFLSRVARSSDMLDECERICERERTWFLNQCGILGAEMDDDVMDQQKYASAAMVLAKALVDMEASEAWKLARARRQTSSPYFAATNSAAASPLEEEDDDYLYVLPELPLHEARRVMTRADFIESYDHANLFTIDSRAMVRADSVPMMNAFRSVCNQPDFAELLEATVNRIGDIESLGRTRELVAKDLWDKKYRLTLADGSRVMMEVQESEDKK